MASGNARIQGPEEANYKTFTLTHAHLTQTPPENNHSAGDSSQFTISRSFFRTLLRYCLACKLAQKMLHLGADPIECCLPLLVQFCGRAIGRVTLQQGD